MSIRLVLKIFKFLFPVWGRGKRGIEVSYTAISDIIPGKSCTLIITPWEICPLRK